MSPIDGRTELYGLVRDDPSASPSPAMHAAAFESQGRNAAYVPLAVRAAELATALQGAHALGFRGLNVGAPHKQAAAAACIKLDPVATTIGAVNTLRRIEGGWHGYNTDAVALAELLDSRGAGVRHALVLGAGGAARATLWALRQRGARALVAAVRADEAELACRAVGPCATFDPLPWSEVPRSALAVDCIVNAMPCDVDQSLLVAAALRPEQVVVDWVYGGTSLTVAAQRVGCALVDGNAILVRQGALANSLWTRLVAPESVMAEALSRAALA